MSDKMTIQIPAYQVLEKVVKLQGNSGRVYLPKEWVGKKVKILLIEQVLTEEVRG